MRVPFAILLLVLAMLVAAGCLGSPATDGGQAVSDNASGATEPGGTVEGSRSEGTATDDPSDGRRYSVTVTHVTDGDTVDVLLDDGSTDTVRLLGVDTPEVHVAVDPAEYEGVPDTAAGRRCLERWGEAASTLASEQLSGAVTLRLDPMSDGRGSYGRLLAYVALPNGTEFNALLLRRGYARHYESSFGRADRYATLEAEARDAGRGLWACREASEDLDASFDGTATDTTQDDTENASELTVVEIRADAPGNDHEHLDEEAVVFGNAGDAPLDVGGWTVRDAAGHVYRVPAGVTIPPDGRLELVTGAGTDDGDTLYWGRDAAVWNNGGDTVVVRDADGATVLERGY
jgi:micrococcal nuclease